jgi:hypothetical protein
MKVEDDIIFQKAGITVAIEEKSSDHPGVSIIADPLMDPRLVREIEMPAEDAIDMAVAILKTCAPWKLRA